MTEVTLQQVLEARDRRVQKQKELLSKYGKTLICFTMNIPGPVKVTPEIEAAFRIGNSLIQSSFSIVHTEDTSANTGFERFYIVNGDPRHIKEECVDIEDSFKLAPWRRLFDMDVLGPNASKLSREELGLPSRKCLICDQNAAICGRSRAHSVPELQQAVARLLEGCVVEFLSEKCANLAIWQELVTTPKPGLVDCNNSGSHKDMNEETFHQSRNAIRSYIEACVITGLEHGDPKALFQDLRIMGMDAEKKMLEATGGVNTHKGAIFSMGIAAAAAARCFPKTDPETVLGYCAQMTQGLVEQDFGKITQPETVGEKLYTQHGITGIRGQAEQGFPAVLKVGYPVLKEGLRRGLSLNNAGCATLLHLLAVTDDTNLIHRSDLATLREIQSRLQKLLADDPYPDLSVIEDLDREFIESNLSPGGSADLLALTYFLHFLNN